MEEKKAAACIAAGGTALGIELGSTRIKAVLVDADGAPLASASHGWENALEGGFWTYSLDAVWAGIQDAFAELMRAVGERYGAGLTHIGAIGISAMMHGYLPLDAEGNLLAPFRTWRNNTTGEAADRLTEAFHFNIPQRWSIAHLYQAMLSREEHVRRLSYLTTLAGYVHWRLSGEKVLGIGDASGMFPIDSARGTYDAAMLETFAQLPEMQTYSWTLSGILPRVLRAGEAAGTLAEEGARLLDPTGQLAAGSLMAPPEGDAGTGMVATNSIRPRTGNISAGTSAFSMHVLEAPLAAVRRDIDMVTTPTGTPVAMVHTNNCTSDLNAWVRLFGELLEACGAKPASGELYGTLFSRVADAEKDAGDLLSYGCLSGENITGVTAGRPLFVRAPHSRMTLANFMLAQIYGAFAPLAIGMESLRAEGVETDSMVAQGGIFETPIIAQQALADALGMAITVMKTAGEGGPWGMALLAAFARFGAEESLADFLSTRVFGAAAGTTLVPTDAGRAGFARFIARYEKGLSVERLAGTAIEDEG